MKPDNTINDVTAVIIDTVRDICSSQQLELPDAFSADSVLFGEGGVLDSMALVGLVIAVEQALEEKFGVVIELASDKALSQRNSPYRTVTALAAFAAQEMADKR